jgi:transposase
MATQRFPGKPEGAKNLTDFQKGAILALKKISNLTYPEIASVVGCSDSAAGRYFRNTSERAATKDPSLPQLLAAAPGPRNIGRPVKVRNYSTLSARIRGAIIEFGSYRMETAVADVLQEAGITLCENTITRIAHEHRDPTHNYAIVRGVRPKKPALDDNDRSNRAVYSRWLIQEFNLHFPRLIFVCYDETLKAIGGKNIRGGKQKISRPQGANADRYSVQYKQPAFSLMICAATSTVTTANFPRPCLVWTKETEEEKTTTLQQVNTANRAARAKVDNKRARATVVGTTEYNALREININIATNNKRAIEQNQAEGRTGAALRRGTKRPKTVDNFFKYDDFVHQAGKGMNGIWYAENVLKKYVFKYYCAIRDEYPGSRIYLVQDNVRLHSLGLRYCAPDIEELGIKFAPHPPNSPDLHPIESCFGRLEGFLQHYDHYGTGEAARKAAEQFIQHVWQEDEEMRQYMADKLHPTYFKKVAESCLDADGNNNFSG